MNERIDALIDQANEIDYETWDPYNQKTVQHYYFSKEKFAELIIKECIQALDENDGSVHHSECLLEHFGVEE